MQLTIGDNTKFRWCKAKVIYFILFSYKPKHFIILDKIIFVPHDSYSYEVHTFKNFKVKKKIQG